MAAHDVLYKYVEELTGEPVDPSQYRPTFTGGMAALDAAITGIAQERKDTISESLEAHTGNTSGGGGGGSNAVEFIVYGYIYDSVADNNISIEFDYNVADKLTEDPVSLTKFERSSYPNIYYEGSAPIGSVLTSNMGLIDIGQDKFFPSTSTVTIYASKEDCFNPSMPYGLFNYALPIDQSDGRPAIILPNSSVFVTISIQFTRMVL